ncbi:TPA: hypothetical protein ACGUOU_004400 [Vibrio vulnificus]|nr:hypothetical protein [Vibrio vulnificus]
MRLKSWVLSVLLFSSSSLAITVDKMVVIPGLNEEKSDIKINNPAAYPVFLRVTLSELESSGETIELDEENFQDWPVYVERNEYLVEPAEEISIVVQHLARQLDIPLEKDRIIAIDIMPESVVDDGVQGQKMNILIGYRVWMILSKDGEIVGKPSVVLTDNGYVLKNDSNSVALFNLDLCETTFKKGGECKGSEFVLSGKEKALNLSEFKNGQATISIRDPYSRYQIKESIRL